MISYLVLFVKQLMMASRPLTSISWTKYPQFKFPANFHHSDTLLMRKWLSTSLYSSPYNKSSCLLLVWNILKTFKSKMIINQTTFSWSRSSWSPSWSLSSWSHHHYHNDYHNNYHDHDHHTMANPPKSLMMMQGNEGVSLPADLPHHNMAYHTNT